MSYFSTISSDDGAFTLVDNVEASAQHTITEAAPVMPDSKTSGENHTESLLSDLALILIFGAISTVVFKRLRQPLVLGYIVAGFLVGPHFLYVPSVTDEANIDFWAQIGIVVLLFSLGLEFSFKKLLNVGGSAMITATSCVVGMLLVGLGLGRLMDFSFINSLFLGAMLSMSSTTIVIKALTDLNMRQRRFAPLTFGVLVCEDLFAVVMMVLLSSIAINNSFEGGELVFSIMKLLFFLVIWFVVGVFLLPTFFRRFRSSINDEILLVLAMGLCFTMAIFSVYSGFSMALGAFVMGSILAGTCEAEHIDKLVKPVKDLFGAVVFISVGMMVDPNIIMEYGGEIVLLSVVVIVGMIFFASFGMIISGQPLKIAMETGFSLTQIGEFSFIIATLGMSLGVLDANMYPIVVSVSVVTTFFTPYIIRLAEPSYNWVERKLPKRLQWLLSRYSNQSSEIDETRRIWRQIIMRFALRVFLYTTLTVAVILVSESLLLPFFVGHWGNMGKLACVGITVAAMAPFLLALAYPSSTARQRAELEALGNRFVGFPLFVLLVLRILVSLGLLVWFISSVYHNLAGVGVCISLLLLVFILFSKDVKRRLRNIEDKFMTNLNERELRKSGKANNLVSDLHVAYMTVGSDCPFVGERLANADIRKNHGVNVVSIQRGAHVIPVPGSTERLFPGDLVGVIGTDAQIAAIVPIVEAGLGNDAASEPQAEVKFTHFTVAFESPLVGQSLATSNLRDGYSSLLVAVQRGDDEFIKPTGNVVFRPGDVLWLVGDMAKIEVLKQMRIPIDTHMTNN